VFASQSRWSISSSWASSSLVASTASYIGEGVNNYVPYWSNNTLAPISNIYTDAYYTVISSSVDFVKDGNLRVRLFGPNDPSGPVINFYAGGGTVINPTQLLSGSYIGQIGFWGHDGNNYQPLAGFKAYAESDISESMSNTSLLFFVREFGSDGVKEVYRISSSGDLVFEME
jgi:hypothetical protein